MTDHDKLREAIKRVRDYRNGKPPYTLLREQPTTVQCIDVVLDAAESTLPKTKMVEVWRVEYAIDRGGLGHPSIWFPCSETHIDRGTAERNADSLKEYVLKQCIRVTGPHMQEVPA